MMSLREILNGKGATVFSIGPDATLADVVDQLVEHNCGSLLVCDSFGKMVGIITERDILRACAARQGALEKLMVRNYMTAKVLTGKLEDSLDATMGLMTEHRVRHLPIFDDQELAGMISIGDLVKTHYNHLSVENHYLKSYIQS